jgi:hypothetical protein
MIFRKVLAGGSGVGLVGALLLGACGSDPAPKGPDEPTGLGAPNGEVLCGDAAETTTLRTAQDVAEHQTCQRVLGNLMLEGPTSVDLPALVRVDGALGVGDTVEVLALPSLSEVGGDLTVARSKLATLALPALTSVSGGITVEKNPALKDIEWPNLGGAVGDVLISKNDQLVDVTLDQVRTFGLLTIIFNAELVSIDIGGGPDAVCNAIVSVAQNHELETLDLGNLTSIELHVIIELNEGLLRLDAGRLRGIGGSLLIGANVAHADGLTPNFGALTSVGEEFAITDNDHFTTLEFPALTKLGGRFRVSGHDHLVALEVKALTAYPDGIRLLDNQVLTAPEFADERISIAGELDITQNSQLIDPGLSQLTGELAGLEVLNNYRLATLELPHITAINGDFWIQDSSDGRGSGLEAPDFSSLARIDGGILVQNNDKLVDAGLGNLASTSNVESIVFINNAALETFDVPVGRVSSDVEILRHGAALKSIELPAQAIGGHVLAAFNEGLERIDVQVEPGFTREVISSENPALTELRAPNVPCDRVVQSAPQLAPPALVCAD